MPISSATRRMVRASGPSRSSSERPTATTSWAREVSASVMRQFHRLLGPALERLVHSGKGGQRAAVEGPRGQRHQDAAEVLLLYQPRAVPRAVAQLEGVLDVEEAGHPEPA